MNQPAGNQNKIFLYGKNPVLEALKSNHLSYALYLQEGLELSSFIALAKKQDVPTFLKKKSEMDGISKGKHQGVILVAERYSYVKLSEVLANPRGKYPLILILDGITDPLNLGAIIRTCDACGVDGVILPSSESVLLDEVVARASAGSIEHVPVVRANISSMISSLKKKGFFIYGMDAKGKTSYLKVDYCAPIALVIGSEGFGMREGVLKECDLLVTIPMKGRLNSLNAGIASAVVLFEVVRQRS